MNRLIWDSWTRPICFTTVMMLAAGISLSQDKFTYTQNERIVKKTGLVAAMYSINSRTYVGSPEEIGRQFLVDNKAQFGFADVSEFKFRKSIKTPAGQHARFIQTYGGIPVFGTQTVISIDARNRVMMAVVGYRPAIQLKTTSPTFLSANAVRVVENKLDVLPVNLIGSPKAELNVYQDSAETYHLTWVIQISVDKPYHDWLAFVDALDGELISLTEVGATYVDGTGRVFNPDPVTALQNTSLSDQNDADYQDLQNAYTNVTLKDLNDRGQDGCYRLQGKYCYSEDFSAPYISPVTSTTTTFSFNRSQSGFEETNIYYHIDTERRYLGSLGFNEIYWYGDDYQAIRIDAHGWGTEHNAKYNLSQVIVFGDGGVDAGEDQGIIVHEYGHALHDALMGDLTQSLSDEQKISEGSGDYLGTSYRLALSSFQSTFYTNWFGVSGGGRYYSSTAKYPGSWWNLENHDAGVLWWSTMRDIQTAIGRDVTTKLLLSSFAEVVPTPPAPLTHVPDVRQPSFLGTNQSQRNDQTPRA